MTELQLPYIVKPNIKGQITIPKHLRDEYCIGEETPLVVSKGQNAIVIKIIQSVKTKSVWNAANRKLLLENLKKTQGLWADAPDETSQIIKRKKLEKKASKRNRAAW